VIPEPYSALEEPELQDGSLADLSRRQKEILNLVYEQGYASIESLAERFSVTTQTIRRDINDLCSRDLLKRFHGGAGVGNSVRNMAYAARKDLLRSEKQAIAAVIAAHMPDYASLFLDIGTTSEEVARSLIGHKGLRIVTNNLNAACLLAGANDFEITVTGGKVRGKDRGLTGESTLEFIDRFKCDYGVLTLSGIDADGTLLDFDYSEVQVARAVMRNSRKVFLAVDHSKFERTPMVRIGHVREVDALFTDREPAREIKDMLASEGVEIFLADSEHLQEIRKEEAAER
jgi:DeoR family glycerol-3-phosphate regulon repressor